MTNFAVDDHRANAADLFETIHLPDGRRRLLSVFRDGIFLNFRQARDDIEIRAIWNLKRFPALRRVRVIAPTYAQLDGLRRIRARRC